LAEKTVTQGISRGETAGMRSVERIILWAETGKKQSLFFQLELTQADK